MFTSLLCLLLALPNNARKQRYPQRRPAFRRPSCRPRLEALETRLAPATFTVNTTLDEVDGVGDPNGLLLSLREAMNPVGAPGLHFGDTITFDTSVFAATLPADQRTIKLDNTGLFVPPQMYCNPGISYLGTLTIMGPTDSSGNNLVTIDGNNSPWGPIFLAATIPVGDSYSINNINFQNFTSSTISGFGTVTYTFNHCTFSNNSASSLVSGQGSSPNGAALNLANLTLQNCVFTDNTAYDGGAVYTSGQSSIIGCTFTGNTATDKGGAIAFVGGLHGNLTIRGTTINGNTANYSGGGVYFDPATVSISSSKITNNSAPVGADIYNVNTTASIVNSTVGSLFNDTGTVTLINSTVANISNNGGTITTPDSAMTNLDAQISALASAGTLTASQASGLTSKVTAADQSLNNGKLTPGVNQLNAFINQLEAFVKSGTPTSAQAQPLIDGANQLISAANIDGAHLLNDPGNTTTTDTQPVTDAGQLVTGQVGVYLDNADGTAVPADEQARFDDAITALDTTFGPNGVDLVDVGVANAANAVVQVQIADTSAAGSAADGVLGCTVAGNITLLTSWNWFTGADPTTIGTGQYDFETIVMHELGHAIGLGHSGDTNSVMYAYLAPGQTRRVVTAADLSVLDSPSTAPAALMAAPWRDTAVASGPNPHAAVVDVGRISNPSVADVGRIGNPSHEEDGRDMAFGMLATEPSRNVSMGPPLLAARNIVFANGLANGPAGQAVALAPNFGSRDSSPLFAAPLPRAEEDSWLDAPLFPDRSQDGVDDAAKLDGSSAHHADQAADFLAADPNLLGY
jgi:predicted outer membrane repeat protein